MIRLRPAAERGSFDHGWLRTKHTFSFGDYRDSQHVHFRTLRVINEDWVAPGQGFGEHPHRDMEIVTYVLAGQLQHRDSLGNGEILRAGELQRMSAGRGITHSEFNPSAREPLHLYQIWLFPAEKGIAPSYEQKRFDPSGRANRWQLVAAPTPEGGSLQIHQDARLYLADVSPDSALAREIAPGRRVWLQVLRGSGRLNDLAVTAGDGVAISDERHFAITSRDGVEVLLFDLA